MQQDVHEVREALGAERQARIERAEERAAGGHTLASPSLDMTEDEQLAYAMLVSQEQADADAIAAAYEEDVALLNLNDDEDATAIFTPPRPRPSRMSSRTSSASTSSLANEAIEEDEEEDDHDSFVGGTSPASIYSNRYYPISPRLMPTAPPDINDDSAFPSPSPRARSPLLSPILGPTTPSKRYSEAAARATPSPTSLSFDISPAPSRRSRQSRPAAEEGDDADLQFAIELSLAEARSRLDGE